MSKRICCDEEFSVVVVSMKNEKNNIKNAQRTIVLKTEPERQGKDELNLVELPFALVGNRNSGQIKTIKKQWSGQDKFGKPKECYLTLTGSDDRGLPTFQAEMVALAAIELTFKKQLDAPVIHTTQYEMCQLLGWPYTSQYRKLLRDMLALLKGITIETNHFYDAETGEHKWAVFGIIESAVFGAGEGFFKWNDILFESLKHGNIKSLDTGIYFSLKRNLSKRLFRYADRHVYNGQKHEIDLKRLCFDKLLMIGKYRGIKNLIRKIQPAIDEINGIEKNGHRLMQISVDKSKNTPSGYKVIFEKAKKSRQHAISAPDGIKEQGTGERPPEAQISRSGGLPDANQALADQLISRGISKTTAQKLIQERPSSVVRHLEIFDFLMAKGENSIENPAGYLRRMIEEEWFLEKAPEGFVSKAEQESRRRDREAAEQKLLVAYQQDLGQALKDLDQLIQLPLKDQVARQLESWKEFVRGYKGSEPSETMIIKRETELIQELGQLTREQRIDRETQRVKQVWIEKARKQGIEDISLTNLD